MSNSVDSKAALAQPASPGTPPQSAAGWRRLGYVWGGIALLWLVVLPAIARWPPFQAEWQRLQSQGIDPSAMYYTELELMKDIYPRLERLHREDPQLLWRTTIRGEPAKPDDVKKP